MKWCKQIEVKHLYLKMIVIFHWFASCVYNLFKKQIDERNSWGNIGTSKSFHPLAQKDLENNIRFDPPVYKQRYERVTDILMDEKWKKQISKVVDFGCAEFGLFVFLKNTVGIKEILFVDIDEILLKDCIFRVYPLNADHLVRRAHQLTVKVFIGSIADPDVNVKDVDAVLGIEIIEHLYPDVLEAVPYNLFSYIQPKIVIISTPNSEFNVLFRKGRKFRHDDHKFEWSREQFESWAKNITLRFPIYTVKFDGVGLGPSGTENFGCCSQLAVFIRKDVCDNYVRENIPCTCKDSTCKSLDTLSSLKCFCNCMDCSPKHSYGICTYNSYYKKSSAPISQENEHNSYYKLVSTIEYPFEIDTRTEEEKVLEELNYRIYSLGHQDGHFYNLDKNRSEIPLGQLCYPGMKQFPSESQIQNILLKFNYRIEECLNQETKRTEICVIYEPEMEESVSGNDTDASGYESDNNKCATDDGHISDWDENEVASCSNQSDKHNKMVVNEDLKAELHLEVIGVKKQEPLLDSGYQKSPSISDESPRSVNAEEAIALDFKNLNNEKPNKLSNILAAFDNFDKINELDALSKDKKYFSFPSNLPHREVMKKICQEIVKNPIAGPSRDPKKKSPKKSISSDSDDSVEDIKSITTCILENSLNKIEIEEHRGHLIQELMQEELPVQQEVVEPVLVVENGDLANNNRDLEGNNYPPEDDQNPAENDNAVDNLEANNVNIDNNNEIVRIAPIENAQEVEEIIVENIEEEPPPIDAEIEAWSSREALFDVNSHVDLLDDFEMDGAVINGIIFPNNYLVVADNSDTPSAPVLPREDTSFPNWLLQIFEEGEAVPSEDDMHDEPHFYCQGDGLGVHPSTVAINDEDDDEGNESGSDTSSSGSVDFANAEASNSIQEMFMTPEGSREDNLVIVGQSIDTADQNSTIESEQDEVFENAEGSESSLITTSCTP